MDVDARVEGLQAEVDRLQARVDELEAALGKTLPVPLEWRLTINEARIFGVLMARELGTKQALMAALYGDRTADEEPMAKIVDVFVCKARAKLRPFGVSIETVWGQGYRLDQDTKARVRERLALEAA